MISTSSREAALLMKAHEIIIRQDKSHSGSHIDQVINLLEEDGLYSSIDETDGLLVDKQSWHSIKSETRIKHEQTKN